MRPGADLFGRSQTDANGVELTDQTDSIIRAAAEQGLPPLLRAETRNSKIEIRKSKIEIRNSKFETRSFADSDQVPLSVA
jgi:hypothetical protein